MLVKRCRGHWQERNSSVDRQQCMGCWHALLLPHARIPCLPASIHRKRLPPSSHAPIVGGDREALVHTCSGTALVQTVAYRVLVRCDDFDGGVFRRVGRSMTVRAIICVRAWARLCRAAIAVHVSNESMIREDQVDLSGCNKF